MLLTTPPPLRFRRLIIDQSSKRVLAGYFCRLRFSYCLRGNVLPTIAGLARMCLEETCVEEIVVNIPYCVGHDDIVLRLVNGPPAQRHPAWQQLCHLPCKLAG